MKHPRILIVGDSLSFSRSHKAQKLEDSWPVLIAETMPNALVWQRSKGGAMSKDVVEECKTFSGYLKSTPPQFDFLVIQVGIVDACPRAIPLFMENFFDNMKRGGTRLKKLTRQVTVGLKFPQIPWVSQKEWRRNIRTILSLSESFTKNIIFIEIAPAMHYLPLNAPGVEINIGKYNAILEEEIASYNSKEGKPNAKFLRLFEPDCGHLILEDGHHLTISGHQHVAKAVKQCMQSENL